MKLKIFLTLIFLYSSGFLSFSQNKKDIKKYKIKSVTEILSITENGKTITYKEHYTTFDKNGRTLEEIEFNKDGSVKNKTTTKYDINDNKIEEMSFHEKRIVKPDSEQKNRKSIYKYNSNNDKTEETEYDLFSGKLLQKQIISYNNKGEKILEETFNGENKLLKKTIYTYDKGLKTGKQTFNNVNILETAKKYSYGF